MRLVDGYTIMMARYRVVLACGLVVGAFLSGCVSPGRVDTDLLSRYQEWARQASPQKRAGEEGINAIQQVVTRPTLPLKIIRDESDLTSRMDLELSDVSMTLREALKLARSNKLVVVPGSMARKLPAVELLLDEAVRLALVNSLDIRVASFEPAIARTDMVAAAAAFDVTMFGSISHEKVDRRTASQLRGSKIRTMPIEIGGQKRTAYGAEVEMRWNVTRTKDNSPFIDIDPRYESVLTLEVTQPLLRFGGKDFNLGQLRIARVAHDISQAAFREQVERTITEVINTYWGLIQARDDADIQQRLLIITIQTHDRVLKRRQIDATRVQIKQAESAVRSRWAALVRAHKIIFDTQDLLARLLADPRMPVSCRYEILPTDSPVDSLITYDPSEQIELAIQNNPTLEQAFLAITAADIAVRVARNETLPLLNAVASSSYNGLRGDPDGAIGDMLTMDFWGHSVGLVFEYPLGNRERKAGLSRRGFERARARTTYFNAADQVAVAVNESIRQIETTHEEYLAQKAAKEAKLIELQALEDTERIRGRLTPEFLQMKLGAQEQLAAAARLELDAIVSYNNALAELTRLTGMLLVRRNIELATESAIGGRPVLPVAAPQANDPGK